MTPEEFQQAVADLRPKLTEQARHYFTDAAEAEDAVQDALLRLWQMHDRLRMPFDGLAAVLLRNHCIDLLRRRHPVGSADVAACGADGAFLAEAADHERIERMMDIVGQLPDLQQTLLRLRHMEGMETRELAALLQMSEVAVRKALSRARMAVREQYLKLQRNEE